MRPDALDSEEQALIEPATEPSGWTTAALLKYGSLALVVVQNSSHVLMLRYTRVVPGVCSAYTISIVVLFAEALKLILCCAIVAWWYRELWSREIVRMAPRLAIPAVCFAVQNNLQFVAATYLTPGTLQLINQLKTITTALFGVCILRKWLRAHQWVALMLLVVGIVLAQWTPGSGLVDRRAAVGVGASIVVSICSGFASVYLEKILKDDDTILWIRNIQLAMFAIPLQASTVLVKDGEIIRSSGPLHGFCASTWALVAMFAFGGLLVSVVIRFADNNLKNMAMAASILLSTVLSIPLFDVYPTSFFAAGAACVVGAIFLYSAQCERGAATK